MNPFSPDARQESIYLQDLQRKKSPVNRDEELNLNIINIDFDTPIYRYMKWDYLETFYKDPEHGWVLVNPSLWQDKFEHFIFKCNKFYNPKFGGFINLDYVADQYYAQCWTLTEENSMQWQINKPHSNNAEDNNPDQDGGEIWVKIRTTPRKLLEGMFYSANNLVPDSFNSLTYFIGKVQYVDEDYIRNYRITNREEIMDPNGLLQVLFLLMKRKPYRCENEIRLIMQVDSDFRKNNNSPLVKRHIDDWYELIDEIVIDPWATDAQVQKVTDFMQKLSCQEKKPMLSVWKSHLNDKPQYVPPVIPY